MRNKLFLLICLVILSISLRASDENVIPITTENTSLIFKVGDNGRLYQSYLGQKLRFDSDIDQLPMGKETYITHGMEDYFEPAIRVLHNDGNPSLLLKYVSSESRELQHNQDLYRNIPSGEKAGYTL